MKRRQGSHNVQSEESRGQTLEAHILLSKGAFCTPRSIIRTITTRKKPSTAEVTDAMKSLADSGIGEFKALSEKEKVFFKPLPSEKAHVGHVDAQLYQERFEVPIDEKYITNAQYNRLLNNSPNKDVLESQFQYNKR